jgi:hypothetical protein
MKGIVFTEFFEMVEQVFSPDMVDELIERSQLATDGAYTAVGTYDHAEIIEMVGHLSTLTGTPVAELVQAFGRYLLGRFTELYPVFFDGVDSTFRFLETIEDHVHVEVKKLYHDVELPSFSTERDGDDTLVMTYRSTRPFAALAEGLIRGSIDHYAESIAVTHEDLSGGIGNHSRFVLQRT